MLRGNYKRRRKAIEKCAYEAVKRGYQFIGIQDGGWCASGPRAHKTFVKYGRSNRCRNGKGGPWANDVYRIIGETVFGEISSFQIGKLAYINSSSIEISNVHNITNAFHFHISLVILLTVYNSYDVSWKILYWIM